LAVLSALRQMCYSRQRIPGTEKKTVVIQTGAPAEGQQRAVPSNWIVK